MQTLTQVEDSPKMILTLPMVQMGVRMCVDGWAMLTKDIKHI
jgi:hypothetical protein